LLQDKDLRLAQLENEYAALREEKRELSKMYFGDGLKNVAKQSNESDIIQDSSNSYGSLIALHKS